MNLFFTNSKQICNYICKSIRFVFNTILPTEGPKHFYTIKVPNKLFAFN